MIHAKVIADSINRLGYRLTTLELNMHRFILAELNTHRVLSRNSASSRAIPVRKMIETVLESPAIPIEFGTAKKGMQAGPPLEGKDAEIAKGIWIDASRSACVHAEELLAMGVHKQVVNRILEPFLPHRVIVSATEWENFFAQRCSPLAQPEINALACAIRDAMKASEPKVLHFEEWHMPYITEEDREQLDKLECVQVSAARCARVSYLNHEGKRDIQADIALFLKLISAEPPHWSPLEHVACPYGRIAEKNFRGWTQLRWFCEENQIHRLAIKG